MNSIYRYILSVKQKMSQFFDTSNLTILQQWNRMTYGITKESLIAWYFKKYLLTLFILSNCNVKLIPISQFLTVLDCFKFSILTCCCFHLHEENSYFEHFLLNRMTFDLVKSILSQKDYIISTDMQLLRSVDSNIISRRIDINSFNDLHFELVANIINVKIRMSSKDDESELQSVLKIIQQLQHQLEGLVMLYRELKLTHKPPKEGNNAYLQITRRRRSNLATKYYNELSKSILKKRTRNKNLYLIRKLIIAYFNIFQSLDWNLIDKRSVPFTRERELIWKNKISIQAILLLTNDLNIVAKFQLIDWGDFRE